jgi:peptidoglycan/xylan/chitin deacetylase (PgdA/CDA1 family)
VRALALEYHDVVRIGSLATSGFASASAASYKVAESAFRRHLTLFDQIPCSRRVLATGLSLQAEELPLLLTFDDGGASAHSLVAPLLEAHGWRGHIFVTTAYLNEPGFLTTAQMRELHERGHCIGTHSVTHPLQMARLSDAALRHEWEDSVALLTDTLNHPVITASIPGGQLSHRVADAAEAAGIRVLFTSEPRRAVVRHHSCVLIGRYAIRHDTTTAVIQRLLQGSPLVQAGYWLPWNARKLLKRVAGPVYLPAREWVFSQLRHWRIKL